jgi:hypothetical protein
MRNVGPVSAANEMRRMKRINNILTATAFVLAAACSPSDDVTAVGLQDVRRNAIASRAAFERTASILVPSGIVWADRVNVRYTLGAEYTRESWDAAQLPPMVKADVLAFMASRTVQAVFVNDRRVNFVLRSSGIAPSGVSMGVLVVPESEHGCASISTPLKLDGNGLLCEKLEGLMYLYFQR